MNLIGKIYPASSKGHNFILVTTDYFTKWVEAVKVKNIGFDGYIYTWILRIYWRYIGDISVDIFT